MNNQITPSQLPEWKIKHLEFIQAVITRLGNTSSLIKGWTLTVVGAFLAFSANQQNWKFTLVALVPVIGFWALDAHYLRQERLYRLLFDRVRATDGNIEPFSMDTAPFIHQVSWFAVVKSRTIFIFYGILCAIDLSFMIGAALE